MEFMCKQTMAYVIRTGGLFKIGQTGWSSVFVWISKNHGSDDGLLCGEEVPYTYAVNEQLSQE